MMHPRPDGLIFKMPDGESIPCSAELVTVNLLGEAAGLLDLEIVQHGARGVLDQFNIEQIPCFPQQVDGNQFGGARDRFTARQFKHQAVRVQLNHVCSSIFLTA